MEITVIEMQRDFNIPLDVTKEKTILSLATQRRRWWRGKMKTQNIKLCLIYSLSFCICSISSGAIASAGRRLPDAHRTL